MPTQSFIRVRWLHSSANDPVDLWSELDADRFEVRKVEVWADGRVGYAATRRAVGDTRLGLEPVPPLEVIAADPQFMPEEISEREFNEFWSSKVL
jgi:hypothetical protein